MFITTMLLYADVF